MKKNHIWSVLPSVLLAAALLGGCARTGGTGTDSQGGTGTTGGNTGAITDDSTVATVPVDTTAHSYALVSQEGDSFTYNGLRVTVEKVQQRRIMKLHIQRLPEGGEKA